MVVGEILTAVMPTVSGVASYYNTLKAFQQLDAIACMYYVRYRAAMLLDLSGLCYAQHYLVVITHLT